MSLFPSLHETFARLHGGIREKKTRANAEQGDEIKAAYAEYASATAFANAILQQHGPGSPQFTGEFLNLSASPYSRIESGNTAISVTQLRQIAARLGIPGQHLLDRADAKAPHLQMQGAQIVHEKKDNSAAILLGLGLLGAALLTASTAGK